MKKVVFHIALILAIVFPALICLGQVGGEYELIPRDVLFDLDERKELIKLSPDASVIYYVRGAYKPIPDDRIYCQPKEQNESFIKFSGAVGDYEVLDKSHLLVRTLSRKGQAIELYSLDDSISNRVFPTFYKSIRWLSFSKDKEAAAFVAMPFDASPLLFTYNFKTNLIDTLSNVAQGHYPLFFDENLNVVAGEKTDRETGDKILSYYKNNQWYPIEIYPYSAERFIRPGLKSIVGVSTDGKEIYFTDNSSTDKTVLKTFSISSEKSEIIIPEQSSDLMTNSFIPGAGGQPIAMANHYSNRKWNVIDSSYENDFHLLNSKFPDFQILDILPDMNFWVVEEMNGGANISYLYNSATKTLKKLFSDHTILESYSRVNRFYNTVSSFDDLQLPIQYYLSKKFDLNEDGIPDKKMPAIIYVHGGPWQGWMEDFWLITRHLQLLADRGYLVVYSQFRGALTYGKHFLNAGDKEWGDGMMKDNVAIANWLSSEKNVLQEKIGIFGWSYGGYAALAGAAFSPQTYACAVSLYGPTYLDALQNENAFGYSPNSLQRIADVTTEDGLKLAHDHSPLYAADRINIPVLMSTGAKDDRVPRMQMDKMADALNQSGKEVTYFVYPKEGHDYVHKTSWTTFWSITEKFLSIHLGGQFERKKEENDSILNMIYQN